MQTKTLISRLTKAGASIESDPNHSSRYVATSAYGTVIWFDQDGSAIAVHTPSRHTDAMTDCFCDRFHHTVKSAVSVITG